MATAFFWIVNGEAPKTSSRWTRNKSAKKVVLSFASYIRLSLSPRVELMRAKKGTGKKKGSSTQGRTTEIRKFWVIKFGAKAGWLIGSESNVRDKVR
jgi:hypothetical protein